MWLCATGGCIQNDQRGTGHAAICAREYLDGFEGNVVVLYGDMPLLSEQTIGVLVQRRDEQDLAAVALTIELENPRDFGRMIRNEAGQVVRIVEMKDCTPAELAVPGGERWSVLLRLPSSAGRTR